MGREGGDYWLGFSGQLLNSPGSLIVCPGQLQTGWGTSQQITFITTAASLLTHYQRYSAQTAARFTSTRGVWITNKISCKLDNNICRSHISYYTATRANINQGQYRFFQQIWHFLKTVFWENIKLHVLNVLNHIFFRFSLKDEKNIIED